MSLRALIDSAVEMEGFPTRTDPRLGEAVRATRGWEHLTVEAQQYLLALSREYPRAARRQLDEEPSAAALLDYLERAASNAHPTFAELRGLERLVGDERVPAVVRAQAAGVRAYLARKATR